MNTRMVRQFIVCLVLATGTSTTVTAGPIAEAVGRTWDKAIGTLVKAHEATTKAIAPKGKLIRAVKSKHGGACGDSCH